MGEGARERMRGAPPSEPKKVRVGEFFAPFEGQKLPDQLKSLEEKQMDLLLRIPMEVTGIPFDVKVYAESLGDFNPAETAVTPLGEPRFTNVIKEGEGGVITEAPLVIEIGLRVESEEQEERLRNLVVEGLFGDRTFSIDGGEALEDADDRPLVSLDFERHARDRDGNRVEVYLPYNQEAIEQVRLRFVKREEVVTPSTG